MKINKEYLERKIYNKYSKYLLPDNKNPKGSMKEMAACAIGIKVRMLNRFINQGIYSKSTLEAAVIEWDLDISKIFIKEN